MQPERGSDLRRLLRDVGAAVVRQPLDDVRRPRAAEAALDAADHEIAHHLARDAAGCGCPGDNLAVAGIDGKQHAHDATYSDLQSSARGIAIIGRPCP